MNTAIEQFRENIIRVRGLGGLYQALDAMTTAAIDASDLLRAQYVLVVSALDHYVHQATRLGMLQIFDGLRPSTPAYRRFRMPMESVRAHMTHADMRVNFEAEIRAQHSFLAFQHPDKIAEAMRLITEIKLWECVAKRLSADRSNLKDRMTLIIDRRNKIAHEADLDPTYPKVRWPIAPTDVEGVVNFLVTTTEAIHAELV